MELELKKDIISSWNEIEETTYNLKTFSDDEILNHKKEIIERLEKALQILGEHFTDEESIEHLNL